jgi:hypothetical protein
VDSKSSRGEKTTFRFEWVKEAAYCGAEILSEEKEQTAVRVLDFLD